MEDLNDLDPDLIFIDDSDAFDSLPEFNTVHKNNTAQIPAAIPDSLDALLADDDDDDFPDFDADELVKAAENAERERHQQETSFEQIVRQDVLQDPVPPAPLSPHTANFHKFDNQKLCTWVYPMNYPTRNYQLNMVQKGLFQNTLIALPTGLGKTFIAAVIMYNFWRWFPESKVVFLAPTRPLVAQQIEACFKICGLPQSETIEMTGQMAIPKRTDHWRTKRVFFMTPQTMQNDLASRICPAEKIACLVIDEAHKATGNYAFVEVVRSIAKSHPHFRVLALTATPGSNLDNVQTVINNLHINNIQIRTEESMDIQAYTHGKQIQRIVVRLSYVEGATGALPRTIKTFQQHVFVPFLKELLKFNAIQTDDPNKNTSFGLMQSRARFRENARNMTNYVRNKVTMTFMTCEALSRANELLCNHGIAPFVESIQGISKQAQTNVDEGKGVIPSDRAIISHAQLSRLITSLKQEMNMPGFIGHPKMERLVNILLDHFANTEAHSKVMVFSSYRTSVDEICRALAVHHPMIRCSEFVGQASGKTGTKGLKQAEQQQIITRFKNDELNTLVCTSIGEEGLDIGEVDLIVCYDSQSSPIRMLQRMGRTGRKRKGRCILLLTESEEKKFNNAKETYTRVQQLIANGSSIRYHPTIPSVIPKNYKPTMARQKLTIGDYVAIVKTKRGPKVAEQDYTTDGKMKESTMNAFIKSFPVGLNTLDALVNHYWPIQSHKTKLNTTIPIQKNLQRSRVSHSKTTRYFTTCIRRMEHRILHPGQDVPVAKVLEQKKLVLPKRQKPLDDRQEPITKKQKKATLDDHYEHFMNHVQEDGMSFLFDQPGPSRPRRDSIDELIKDIQLDVQDGKGKKRADIVMDAKGKKKAVDDIDDLLMDMFDDDFETSFHDIKGKRRAVEPLLKQRKKTKTSDHSIHVDKSYVDKPASNNIENTPSNSAFEQRSWSSILPASPPAQDDKKSTLPEDDVLGGDDFGGDDFGDADPGDADPGGNADPGGDADPGDADFGDDYGSFGDTMFNDAALEQWDNMAAFNEDLAPIYPFDKPQVSSQVEIKCIFPQPATFSEKAIGLLKQRYPSLRKDTLLVKIIAQLMTDSPHDSDDYSFGDNMDFEEMLKEVDIHGIAKKSDPIVIQDSQPAMKEPREEMKPIKEIKPIKESKPTVKPMQDSPPIVPNMSEPFENHDEPDDEPDEDMFGSEIAFDLDDEVFINMIENKDTEGGGGAEEISFYLQSQYDKSFRKASQKKPTLDNQQTVNTEREALQLEDGTRESTQPLQDEGESTQPLQEKTSASTDPIKQEEDILIFSSFGDPLEKTVIIPEPNQQGLFLSEGPSQPHEDVPDTSSQSSAQNLDDLNSSLLVHTKKKKGRILLDEEDSTVILDSPERPVVGIYKRLKELSRMVDSQEDDFEPRVKESRYQSGPSRVPNPYFEMEAERSEDDISADEEEEGNEEELDDSFINDEESFMTQQQALRHQEVSPVRWMRGFHAEKWLQPQEDDTIIDDEEDEEEISGSSILPTVIDQDDDFM